MNERILIIQTAFLGDAVLTLPLIQASQKIFPSSEIDVVAIPSTQAIFKSSPHVKKVFSLDKKGKQKKLVSLIKFAFQIRKRKYSKIISPHRSFRTSLIILVSGVTETYGFDISSMSFIYRHKIKYRKDWHEVRRNLSLLNNKEFEENWNIKPEVLIASEVKSKINNLLGDIGDTKIAAVAPGSVWKTKKYPFEYFEEIIDFLISKSYKVVLIGGKEDAEEMNLLSAKFDNRVESFAGKLIIVESIELLNRCDFLICNDSAPTHLGMAADIPVLTLYCSTVADFGFYPYNEKSSYLSYDDLDCKPCGIHGYEECPLGHFNCGKFLDPDFVIQKLKSFQN